MPPNEPEIHPSGGEDFAEASETLGGRIRVARIAKGMTAAELAQRVGVKPTTVEAWESARREPRANRVQTLAGLLDVSLMWLMSGIDNGTHHVEGHVSAMAAGPDMLDDVRLVKRALLDAVARVEALERRLEG